MTVCHPLATERLECVVQEAARQRFGGQPFLRCPNPQRAHIILRQRRSNSGGKRQRVLGNLFPIGEFIRVHRLGDKIRIAERSVVMGAARNVVAI